MSVLFSSGLLLQAGDVGSANTTFDIFAYYGSPVAPITYHFIVETGVIRGAPAVIDTAVTIGNVQVALQSIGFDPSTEGTIDIFGEVRGPGGIGGRLIDDGLVKTIGGQGGGGAGTEPGPLFDAGQTGNAGTADAGGLGAATHTHIIDNNNVEVGRGGHAIKCDHVLIVNVWGKLYGGGGGGGGGGHILTLDSPGGDGGAPGSAGDQGITVGVPGGEAGYAVYAPGFSPTVNTMSGGAVLGAVS